MQKRPPVIVPCGILGVLGLIRGLAEFRRLCTPLVERMTELMKLPHPLSILWIRGLRGPLDTLDALERPLTAVAVVLLLALFWALGRCLNAEFRLLKPPGENPGRGAGAHLDLPLLFRCGLAALLSLWLLGILSPVALLPSDIRKANLAGILLGGAPAWTQPLGDPLAGVLQALLLVPLLWLLWGPRGFVCPAGEVRRRDVLRWGFAAGIYAIPAFLILSLAPRWIPAASDAFSQADRAGWQTLELLSLALPVAAAVYLGAGLIVFRPRPLPQGLPLSLPAGACVPVLLGAAAFAAAQGALARLDVGRASLAAAIHRPASGLARFALVLAPWGQALYSITPDQTIDETGRDGLAIRPENEAAVRGFLDRRRGRTRLAFRAYTHLHDAWAVNWTREESLKVALEMLEMLPSPVAAQLVMEELTDCQITPDTRRILDTFADPDRFEWPEPLGRTWLGSIYLRFGDNQRARDYLLRAQLPQEQLRGLLGGVSPLTDGTVQGTITIAGKKEAGVRVGLLRLDPRRSWRSLLRTCPPSEWRRVCAVTHTDARGKFSIPHLGEGRYILIVTGGSIGRTKGIPIVTGHPGMIGLDRFFARRVLDPIDIRYVAPVPMPPGGGRGEPSTSV